MKQIIDGKTYNTETATEVCDLPCNYFGGDFQFHNTKLYQTKKGTFFLAGKGGPMSMWAVSSGNGVTGSSGIRVLTEQEARTYMEEAQCDEDDYKKVGLEIEEG